MNISDFQLRASDGEKKFSANGNACTVTTSKFVKHYELQQNGDWLCTDTFAYPK